MVVETRIAWGEQRWSPRQSFLSGKLLSRQRAAETAPPSWVEEGGSSTCASCVSVGLLRLWVEELQEEIIRLCYIWGGEQEIEYYSRLCRKKY